MQQKQLNPGYIASFSMELHLMMEAGIPLTQAMELLRDGETDGILRQHLDTMATLLGQGHPLAVALAQSQVFPQYMVDMVAMGEKTGYLDQGLKVLALHYERQQRLSQSLGRAVVYPTALLLVLLLVMGVLVMEVLPLFADVYAQLGATMSTVGIGLLQFGMAIKAHWLVVLICLVAAVVLVALWAHQGRKNGVRVLFSKKLGLQVASAKLSSVLSMALRSGLDLDMSVALAKDMTQHPVLQKKLEACQGEMNQGVAFATAANQAALFSPLHCRLLGVGSQTGTLDQVMDDIAQRSDQAAQDAIDGYVASVEPTLVVVMSVMVGVVLLSVMLPLASIMSVLG